MPKLNRSLVISIIADIRELSCVEIELCSRLDKVEYVSWKFPTRAARNINAIEMIEQYDGSAGELYILLLELVYDRIHFILRLIVEYMDNYPFLEDLFKEAKNVKRPNFMTLASLIRLAWNRLKALPDFISQNLIKANIKKVDDDSFVGRVSRASQAATSLNYCESCALAERTILEMIEMIDRVFQENKLISAVVTQRELSRLDVFEKTQWAVMDKLGNAMNQDMESMTKLIRETTKKLELTKEDSDKTITSLQAELNIKKIEMNALEDKNEEISKRMGIVTKQLETLKDQQFKIDEQNQTLATSLDDAKAKMSIVVNWNAALQSQMIDAAESKRILENTVKHLHDEVDIVREEARLEMENQRSLLADLQNENNAIRARSSNKIENLEQKLSKLQRKVEPKSTNDVAEETILTPEDDPEVDMMQQLISNREKIEMLVRQNERISKTLNRLRDHRTRSDGFRTSSGIDDRKDRTPRACTNNSSR